MTRYTILVPVLPLLLFALPRIIAVHIQGGTATLGGANDQCTDIQEFKCINDICDTAGQCRNGDADSVACNPGQYCGKPTAGHCLDTTISQNGIHAMPGSKDGTPKHFFCVNVQQFDTPVILWSNNDCTGSSCFVPGNGNFATWQRGAQGNCVEIGVSTPVNTTACLSAGQKSQFPPQGGFPSNVPEPVGGDYGLPVAWENNQECTALSSAPTAISPNSTQPPALGSDQRYFSGISDNQGFSVNDLYKRNRALVKRANPVTSALRNAYNYRGNFIAANSIWLVINAAGQLRAWTGSVVGNRLSVDHIVELDMIVTFFTTTIGQNQGVQLTQNQWRLLSNFVASQGIQAVTGGNCPLYAQFAAYVGGFGNMCGVDQRLNQLKAVVLSHLMPSISYPGTPAPNFASTWSRAEAQGTLEYLMFTASQATEAARDIGNFLDGLPGMGTNGIVAQAFVTFTDNLFNAAVNLLDLATQQPRGYFIGD